MVNTLHNMQVMTITKLSRDVYDTVIHCTHVYNLNLRMSLTLPFDTHASHIQTIQLSSILAFIMHIYI